MNSSLMDRRPVGARLAPDSRSLQVEFEIFCERTKEKEVNAKLNVTNRSHFVLVLAWRLLAQ